MSSFVDELISAGYLRQPELIQTMRAVNRHNYGLTTSAFHSSPIGYDQVISAFNVHAMACEALYPALVRPNARILDVGCGSGYLTAVFARLNPSATVYGVECRPELVELSRNNLMKGDGDLLSGGRVVVVHGDASQGYPYGAPYDAIHVGAAAEELPMALVNELKVGGMMLIPIGPLRIGQTFTKVINRS